MQYYYSSAEAEMTLFNPGIIIDDIPSVLLMTVAKADNDPITNGNDDWPSIILAY